MAMKVYKMALVVLSSHLRADTLEGMGEVLADKLTHIVD
jgi:hypothetical protein